MKRSWLIWAIALAALSGCKKKPAATESKLETVIAIENKTGVVFYPKSTEWGNGSSTGDETGTAATARQTDDEPEKVIEFYKKEIKDAKVRNENVGDIVHTTITGKTKDGSEAEVLVLKMPKQKTQIFVSVPRRK